MPHSYATKMLRDFPGAPNSELPETLEIRPAAWQKVFAFAIFVLLTATTALILVGAFFPTDIERFFSEADQPSLSSRTLGALLSFFLFPWGLYIWWATLRSSIRANTEGIEQSNGFYSQRVRWSEVASYALEQNLGATETLVEPILRDANGKVIFRPIIPIFVSDAATQRKRELFWQFVEGQLQRHLRAS